MVRRPPYVRRRQFAIALIVFPLGLMTILGWVTGHRLFPWLAGLTIGLGIASATWYVLFDRRLRRRIDTYRALCPNCSYPLRPETQRCSECGKVVQYEEAIEQWRNVPL